MINRKTAVTLIAAAVLCTVGVGAIVLRILHTYTRFQIEEPFATGTFIAAVLAGPAGCSLACWLAVRSFVDANRRLRAENAALRARERNHQELLDAVKAADEQGEINGVRLTKALELLQDVRRHQVADEKTDPRGIPRLHRINGGA